ncbi:unnamed protein product [Trichobilharzia regenti]|nr:unnamed protein product [Trichobilharzia regenti]
MEVCLPSTICSGRTSEHVEARVALPPDVSNEIAMRILNNSFEQEYAAAHLSSGKIIRDSEVISLTEIVFLDIPG